MTNKLINAGLEVSERQNGTLYRAFTGGNTTLMNHYLGYGNFTEIEEYAEYPYRRVWIDEANKTTLTYCEGDVTFKVCNDWNLELEDMERFYSEY